MNNLNGFLSFHGKVSGQMGSNLITNVEANPSGTPTGILTSIRVGDIIYSIPSGGSGDYDDLSDKPQINGVTLEGDKSSSDLHLISEVHDVGPAAEVNFEADDTLPLLNCICEFEPSQDLHGYSKPWAGGAGKNKFNIDENRIGIDYDNSSSLSRFWQTVSLPNGNYTISFNGNMTGISEISFGKADIMLPFSSINQHVLRTVMSSSNTALTVTIDASYPFAFIGVIKSGGSITKADIDNLQIQIETGNTATTYEPYSNICPISGHTDVTVTVASTSGGSGEDTTVSLGRTVYGGNLDVTTGELEVTWGNIASYAGETLTGEWLSSLDEYSTLGTPTTGAQVVYELATPQTFTLTEEQIQTLLGQNYVRCDTGDIQVTYATDIVDPLLKWLLENR